MEAGRYIGWDPWGVFSPVYGTDLPWAWYRRDWAKTESVGGGTSGVVRERETRDCQEQRLSRTEGGRVPILEELPSPRFRPRVTPLMIEWKGRRGYVMT